MDLKNPLFLYIGIPALIVSVALMFFLRKESKKKYQGGSKAANTEFIKNQKAFRNRKIFLYFFETIFFTSMCVALASVFVLAARPFKTKNTTGDVKKRDIFLCMDVSYSLYELNSEVANKLESVVQGMNGDRFGVTIFNTSAVTYVPMTDDYDFVVQRLEELKPYFDAEQKYMTEFGQYDYGFEVPESQYQEYQDLYNTLSYYDAGTLTDNTYKGSSLIGVGLASTLYSFPKFNEDERTRVIILSTDNCESAIVQPEIELAGAAEKCAKRNVRVYGIFSKTQYVIDMYGEPYVDEQYADLRKACEKTGGKAYEVTADNTVSDIISNIEATEAKTVHIQSQTRDIEFPEKPAIVLLIMLLIMSVTGILIKR